MPVQCPQRGKRIQAFGGDGAFSGRLVTDGNLGVVPSGGLDELCGGAGVEAVGGVEGEGYGTGRGSGFRC